MTWSAEAFRSPSGLSETNMRPVFVGFPEPPVKATTAEASGSEETVFANSLIFALMAGKEMSWSPWMLPTIRPTSCWGKKPLGTMMKRYTLSPIVRMVAAAVSRGWRKTQRRLRA